jgi:acetaldehyde dehydrogenase
MPKVLFVLTSHDRLGDKVDRDGDRGAIVESVREMLAESAYVCGYRLTAEPRFECTRVMVLFEIEGAGDFLERYSGNLDLITGAAAWVGEQLAQEIPSEVMA